MDRADDNIPPKKRNDRRCDNIAQRDRQEKTANVHANATSTVSGPPTLAMNVKESTKRLCGVRCEVKPLSARN